MSRDSVYLRHIFDAIAKIERYTAVGQERFFVESRWQDAVIRQFEIIGEATKRLSVDCRDRYPEVPWRRMAGLRDVLIHAYNGINLLMVWEVTRQALPDLKRNLESILEAENHT